MIVTATWRSGDAAVCKTVYPGSIPGVASSFRDLPSSRLTELRVPSNVVIWNGTQGECVMKALRKLSGFAAVTALSGMLAMPVAPAQASVQGRDTLLGAGIGALAGGLLGHGKIGPVLGGAAVGAAVGAVAAPHHKHTTSYYDAYGNRHKYTYYTRKEYYSHSGYPYDVYGYYDPYGYYPSG